MVVFSALVYNPTHNFLRHSLAWSMLNSGKLTKPSAFSSWERTENSEMKNCLCKKTNGPFCADNHADEWPALCPHLFIGVPVQAGIFQHNPVLLPFLREVTLCILLLPEPSLTVTLTQVSAGDSPLTNRGQGSSWEGQRERESESRDVNVGIINERTGRNRIKTVTFFDVLPYNGREMSWHNYSEWEYVMNVCRKK